ncbi:MAG: thioesterase family protein [Gammaproteobacteria bacterium]|nr:thioesterase family protein [Gammaproteobacteria bacterium]MBT4494894.1 thioesterase family protein [Gammaproteobacteria bacterium]MBT7371878.1 thioesterase family protein [Gammaproteobacteria bacterium]
MTAFDQDTAIEQIAENRFKGFVGNGWNIGDNPNGGYLLSLVSNAIGKVVAHPDPISFTTHFLRPGLPGESCEIDVDVVRSGRTLTTVRATMIQADKPRLEVVAAYSNLAESAGLDGDITIDEPGFPSPEACVGRTGDMQGIDIALVEKLDIMLHPEQSEPGASGVAEISGWIRHSDLREPDSRSLLLFCDSFPPSPLGLLGYVGWVPTLELTVHVRRRPSPGWIKARFRTDDLSRGRMIESGCLWDCTGALVAECRQVGLIRA